MNLQTFLLKTFVELLTPIVATYSIICLLQQIGIDLPNPNPLRKR